MLESLAQSKINEGKSSARAAGSSGIQKVAGKILFKYILIFSILLALPAALSWVLFDQRPAFYIGVQVYAVLIGILHVWQMGVRFGWRNINSFNQKMNLSLGILLSGMILQAIVIFFCERMSGFWYIFPSSLMLFLFPMLTISTFDFAVNIPPAIFKKWRYQENIIPPESLDFSTSQIIIITFELRKSVRDRDNTSIKFKAPQDRLSFGELFLFYMTEYNERNRENSIQYLDETLRPYDWHFYIKPSKWWQSRDYIDPSLTIRENKILENMTIISERV